MVTYFVFFFFQAEDGIRVLVRSRGLGDVYKRQDYSGISLENGNIDISSNIPQIPYIAVKTAYRYFQRLFRLLVE